MDKVIKPGIFSGKTLSKPLSHSYHTPIYSVHIPYNSCGLPVYDPPLYTSGSSTGELRLPFEKNIYAK